MIDLGQRGIPMETWPHRPFWFKWIDTQRLFSAFVAVLRNLHPHLASEPLDKPHLSRVTCDQPMILCKLKCAIKALCGPVPTLENVSKAISEHSERYHRTSAILENIADGANSLFLCHCNTYLSDSYENHSTEAKRRSMRRLASATADCFRSAKVSSVDCERKGRSARVGYASAHQLSHWRIRTILYPRYR